LGSISAWNASLFRLPLDTALTKLKGGGNEAYSERKLNLAQQCHWLFGEGKVSSSPPRGNREGGGLFPQRNGEKGGGASEVFKPSFCPAPTAERKKTSPWLRVEGTGGLVGNAFEEGGSDYKPIVPLNCGRKKARESLTRASLKKITLDREEIEDCQYRNCM